MYEKLRKEVDELFKDAPRTARANELKEEVLANLIDRYNDLISEGKSEEEAIKKAIAGVGDVDELISALRKNDVFSYEEMKKDKQKSALILSVSVGLYIMSVVILILFTEVFHISGEISVCVMLTMVAIATGLIIYNSKSYTKYVKSDDTLVEDFKEWKSTKTKNEEVMESIKSIIWTITVAIYLIVSFGFNSWRYSWIIFIIGVAIKKIITLIFQMKE